MVDVSVIIPSRCEQFLTKTIKDVAAKSGETTEIIAVLEGYWPAPDEIVNHPRVHYIHFSKPRGMRGALNAGVAIARGKFVMKLDAHCMVGEGFDKVLAETCRDNWVCVPTRQRLDAENWCIKADKRPPINYKYLHVNEHYGVGCKEWQQKNKDRSLDAIRIDDIIGCQGSCYFLPRDFWYELELLDEENYGSFRKDPQEIMFKALSIGGRCVRVKDTWYAHLHKGRQYGRGYRASKSDHVKGDKYSLKWLTDEAWPKQKIPFRDIVARFPDMPGWENHPWMQGEKKVTRRLPRVYQILTLPNGEPFSQPRAERSQSRFWNEGRWDNFIAPLLPKDVSDQAFVEMGANVGLFLKLAKDHGFDRVIGIEKNKTPVRVGTEYRDTIGYDYTLLKRSLGNDFDEPGTFSIDELPVADVTLMSTFHYHLRINAWVKYLDRLAAKTGYVLIVSANKVRGAFHWRARPEYTAVRKYFADWEECGVIENVSTEGDTSPRDMYSVLLKSPTIQRVPLDSIELRSDVVDPKYQILVGLAELIASGKSFDPFDTDYYRMWKEEKKNRWKEKTLRQFVGGKTAVMTSIRDDGLLDPIVVVSYRNRLLLSDGGHRLAMLRALGHKSVIVRAV